MCQLCEKAKSDITLLSLKMLALELHINQVSEELGVPLPIDKVQESNKVLEEKSTKN